MPETALLHCPIRGQLAAKQRAADQLTFTEEKQRIDAIRYLLHRHYPRENFGIETTLFRLGNKGRNSFRTDFAVYDTAFDDLRGESLDVKLDHIRLLAEIKRDNIHAEEAKATQVRSALRLVPDLSTLGVYWDDVEQRFFYRSISRERKQEIHEAPISKIPEWGASVGSISLRYKDLDPAKNLVKIFDELENALHPYVVDKPKRYALILQLLLTKIHDENLHQERTGPLDLQDFSIEAIADSVVTQRMNLALERALSHYQKYLPEKIEKRFRCPAEGLRRVTKILAPINIMRSKSQVIQAFYMKFAKSLYKWDLAQYFTPHEVIDFIVDVANPQYGEHVKDPACGSADFLISAFRKAGGASTDDSRNCVWGSDNSEQAAQISILNMVLNGDGKTQIRTEDSLEAYNSNSQQFSVVLCNPPFGTKIVEKRFEVLRKFDMGHVWVSDNGEARQTEVARTSQQTGILFAELCVRLAEPGGRIAIILPNGYLGNRSIVYIALRNWLLRHARIAGIVAFPRFTFKKAGADVSASVVFLEKRKKPLTRASDAKGYQFYVGNVESVGWRAGDKKAVPIYLLNQDTGVKILDEENEPILDADFAGILDEFLRSPASNCFSWLLEDREIRQGPQGWSVSIEVITRLRDLNLDPKRHSAKFNELRSKIEATDHFRLGDILETVPTERFRPGVSAMYKYVEIERVGVGVYDYEEMRGWQLPDRARLTAKPGDIFIPHIWGCAGKWFIAAGDCENLVITNGCARLRLKPSKEKYRIDLALGLCSEAFSVQMRALATGSDGLAEISDNDLLDVMLPRVRDPGLRRRLENQIAPLITGEARFSKAIDTMIEAMPDFPIPQPRKSHGVLV